MYTEDRPLDLSVQEQCPDLENFLGITYKCGVLIATITVVISKSMIA